LIAGEVRFHDELDAATEAQGRRALLGRTLRAPPIAPGIIRHRK
jgi:hypothetical protein